MARKTKNSDSPITLFSFQDIITSITGIMILVVLMLILHIIESHSSSASEESPRMKDIASLRKTLEEMEKKLKQEANWQAENEKIIADAVTSDLESLPFKINEEKRTNAKLNSNFSENKKVLENLKAEKEILDKKCILIDKQIEEAEEINADKEKEHQNILDMLAKLLENLKKEKESEEKRIYFSLERQEGKMPILAECSSAGIKVKIVKNSEIKEFSDDSSSFVGTVNSFTDWLEKRGTNESEYILFIVKPSSSRYVITLRDKVAALKYETGLEPVEENMNSVF